MTKEKIGLSDKTLEEIKMKKGKVVKVKMENVDAFALIQAIHMAQEEKRSGK